MSSPSSFRFLAAPEKLYGSTVASVDALRSNPRRVAVDLLRLFLANKTPCTLWGPVGARKTRTIEGLSGELDSTGVPVQVITIQPSTQDPTAIHGLMYTARVGEDTVMKRSIPDVAKQVMDHWNEHGGLTILFADEMTTCLVSQQNAMLGLLTHGKFEGIDISPYVSIVMAANPEGTVSTVNPLGEAVVNRGGHLAWYGDVGLYLEDWSSGFGDPRRVPDPTVEWYVRSLLEAAPAEAFRKPGNWEPETLVPYDLMEHTERSVTETARMIELVNESLAGAPDAVRHEYIVEATRALLGNEWASRISTITRTEKDRLGYRHAVAAVRAARVSHASTEEELVTALGSSLHELPSGAALRTDQLTTLADSLVANIESETGFSYDTYLTVWALAVTAPSPGARMSLHAHLVTVMDLVRVAVGAGVVPREEAVPAFVSPELRAVIREARKAAVGS